MANSRTSEGWVYFIGSGVGEPVKIGHTTCLEKRLVSIQNGNHRQLDIHAALLVPIAGDLEYLLHQRFKAHHVRGEWFTWSRGIGRMIKDIRRPCPFALRALKCLGHTKIGGQYRRVEVAPAEISPW